jgi:hypothetical protein
MRRWWMAAAWTGGFLVLFAFFLRIALSLQIDSDGSNNALQAWDMLHGNLLLHGWIIGDATYYTFELPVYVITEFFFGLHSVALHVAPAITYLIVAVCAVAVARTGSRGAATAARCGIVVAVMASALDTHGGKWILLAKPDHIGTSAILLASFLLIDRATARRFTAPLLCAILCAGQIGDALVLYVAVPTIFVVCAYRAVAARKLRSADTAIALAAALSVPLALLIRAWMLRAGAYTMVSPPTSLASPGRWGKNASLTWHSIKSLYGTIATPGSALGAVGAVFGIACLLAAAFGFAKVIWRWRRASRAEQLLCVAIVVNVAAYLFSTVPVPTNPREIAALVPCGAVLAARGLVPGAIASARWARLAAATAAAAALLPLTAAAAMPTEPPLAQNLAAWLAAHGLRYGIGGYWDASAISAVSSNHVQVRAVVIMQRQITAYGWETKPAWYDAAQHDATFVIADFGSVTRTNISAAQFEQSLGRPAAVYEVGAHQILVYPSNVLRSVTSTSY